METEILTKYEEVQNALAAVDDVLESISLLDNISSAGELHETMPRLLASLGHYSLSDRAYIFSWVSEERTELHMVHEWCAEGVRPTMDEMQHVRMEDMPHWAFSLYNGDPIVSMDWDAQRVNSPEEFALFDGQDIHALMVIPVFSGKKLNGYIGFDNPDPSRTTLSLRLLTSWEPAGKSVHDGRAGEEAGVFTEQSAGTAPGENDSGCAEY